MNIQWRKVLKNENAQFHVGDIKPWAPDPGFAYQNRYKQRQFEMKLSHPVKRSLTYAFISRVLKSPRQTNKPLDLLQEVNGAQAHHPHRTTTLGKLAF